MLEVAIPFRSFPKTYLPAPASVTVAALPKIKVLLPLAIFPLVKVSTPLTVASTPLSESPAALFNVKLLKATGVLPLMVCPLLPLKENVLVPASKVPLFEKFPAMPCVKDPAVNEVPLPILKFPAVVTAARAVAEAVPDMEKFPPMLNAPPGIVFTPLPLRIRVE